jgi:hypothetical protein
MRKKRLAFSLSLIVLGFSEWLRATGSDHVRTLQIVGLIAAVTCLASALAILRSSRKARSQD